MLAKTNASSPRIRGGSLSLDVERIVDVFFVFFGFWTLTVNAVVAFGADFRSLVALSPLPVLGTVLADWRLRPKLKGAKPTGGCVEETYDFRRRTFLITAAVCNAAILAFSESHVLFWVVGLGLLSYNYLMVIRRAGAAAAYFESVPLRWSSSGYALVLLAGIAALSPITFRDWNPDDAFYLNAVNNLLDHPNWPVQRLDGMHGESTLGILLPAYWVHSYEPFVAWVAYILRLDPATAYYIVVPPVLSVFAVLVYWLVLRRFVNGGAVVAVAASVIILVVWPQSLGSWTGKAWLGIVAVPAIIFFALRFGSDCSVRSGLLLALSQIAAVGFSSSATIVAPLTVALTMLGSLQFEPGWARKLGLGLLTSVPPIVALAVIFFGLKARGGLTCDSAEQWLYAEGYVKYLVILGFFAAAILPGPAATMRLRAGILAIVFLVLFNPLSSHVMAQATSGNMSWRIFWSFPMPLAAGIGAGCLWVSSRAHRKLAAFVVFGAIAAAFALDRKSILESWSYFEPNFANYQLGPEWPVAKAAVALTPANGVILAIGEVSQWVPTIRHAPKLLVVRPHYISCMRSEFGEAEAKVRLDLVQFIEAVHDLDSAATNRAVDELVRRGVSTIVFRSTSKRDLLTERLRDLGYSAVTLDNFQIWARPAEESKPARSLSGLRGVVR